MGIVTKLSQQNNITVMGFVVGKTNLINIKLNQDINIQGKTETIELVAVWRRNNSSQILHRFLEIIKT